MRKAELEAPLLQNMEGHLQISMEVWGDNAKINWKCPADSRNINLQYIILIFSVMVIYMGDIILLYLSCEHGLEQ